MFRETALLARSYGWSLDAILDLEHPDRRRFVAELAHLEHHA